METHGNFGGFQSHLGNLVKIQGHRPILLQ